MTQIDTNCNTGRKRAARLGGELLAKMKGTGWQLRVWENLGWHYEVHNCVGDREVSVRVHYGKYSVLFGHNGGEIFWTERKSYDDPNEAVRQQLKLARKFVDDLNVEVTKAEKVCQ
jgi:hypothetical protein